MGKQYDRRSGSQKTECPRPLRVLVVEDHADTRRGLEMFLKVLGHHAQLAGGVQEALHVAASGEKFDLLLSDLRLPDGDGWELLRRLEEEGQCPPRAIALSGWGSDEDLAKSKAAGFQGHLVKPPAPQALEAALREAAEALQAQKG